MVIETGYALPVTWPEVEAYMRNYALTSDQRVGQAYFNALHEIYPEVADLVRSTLADPFYAEKVNDKRFEKFFDTIIPYFK